MHPDLFSDDGSNHSGNEQLAAFIAPLAKHSDAVIEDPKLLYIAEAIFVAYSTTSSEGGLSRRDLWAACSHLCAEEVFQQRFSTFKRLHMLLPVVRKDHEERYVLHPLSMAGVLVAQRLQERGGASELLTLLNSASDAIKRDAMEEEDIRATLLSSRRILIILTEHLSTIVGTRPLPELIAERGHHEHPELMDKVESLNRLVTERFPQLDPLAVTVTTSAQRWVSACLRFLDRLLDEGSRSEDFRILHHEQYRTAALSASPELLAEVFTHVIVDPPDPGIHESAIAEAVGALETHVPPPPRPLRAEYPDPVKDPLSRIEEQTRIKREGARRLAETILGEQSHTSLDDYLLSLGWPAAGEQLMQLMNEGKQEGSEHNVFTYDFLRASIESVTYQTSAEIVRFPTEPPEPPEPPVSQSSGGFDDGGEEEEGHDQT